MKSLAPSSATLGVITKSFTSVSSAILFRLLILSAAAYFLFAAYLADESLAATAVQIKQELNLDSRQLGWIYSAGFGPNVIIVFFAGLCIDRYGVRTMSLLYSTFILIGTAVFAFVPGFWGKVAGRFLFGLGMEPLEVCQDAILVRWFSSTPTPNESKVMDAWSVDEPDETASTTTGDGETDADPSTTENEADIDESDEQDTQYDPINLGKPSRRSGSVGSGAGPAGDSPALPTVPEADNEDLNDEEEEELDEVSIDAELENASDGPEAPRLVPTGIWAWLNPSLPAAFGLCFAVGIAGQMVGLNVLPDLADYGGSISYAYAFVFIVCVTSWLSNLAYCALDRRYHGIFPFAAFFAGFPQPSADDIESATSTTGKLQEESVDDSKTSDAPIASAVPVEAPAFENPFTVLRSFPTTYWLMVVISVLGYSCQYVFMVYGADYLNEKWAFDSAWAGRVASIVYFLAMILSPLVGATIERRGHCLTLMGVGLGIFSAACFALGLSDPSVTPIPAIVVMGIAYALVPASIWAAVSRVTPEKHAGTAFGTITSFNSFGLLVIPYAVAYLHDTMPYGYDSMSLVFAVAAIVSLLAVALMRLIQPDLNLKNSELKQC